MEVYGAGLLWCALAVSWPAWSDLGSVLGWSQAWPSWVRQLHLGAWIGSVGLAYLALLSGAVSARDYGLDLGASLLRIPHLLEALFLGLILAVGSARIQAGDGHLTLLEEPRWALYRALGWAWSGSLPLGLGVAIVLALLERILERVRTQGSPRGILQDRSWLLRVIYSNCLFGLTLNFWLLLLGRVVNEALQQSRCFRQIVRTGQDESSPGSP